MASGPIEVVRRTIERMESGVGETDTEYWRGYARALRDVMKRLPTDIPSYDEEENE